MCFRCQNTKMNDKSEEGDPSDPRVIEVKRPNEVKLAEVKKPQEVVSMALKDSLKFGILIGNIFKRKKRSRDFLIII